MLRISLIGPGDIKFYYSKILRISSEKLKKEINSIAKILTQSNIEIELTPDKGIALEIAKEYKKQNGKNVIASVPKKDKAYGIKHLEPYLNTKISNKKLFDKEIDTGDWRQQNRLKALLGDAILILGLSSGTNIEINYGIYFYSSSDNNNLTSNTGTSGSSYGIYFSSSSNNNLTSNTGTSNSSYGIYLRSSSDNNLLINNSGISNESYGINIYF
ncbi:MAG: NosD domain-containing protein, partial [Nanoarchaeota archaeon]